MCHFDNKVSLKLIASKLLTLVDYLKKEHGAVLWHNFFALFPTAFVYLEWLHVCVMLLALLAYSDTGCVGRGYSVPTKYASTMWLLERMLTTARASPAGLEPRLAAIDWTRNRLHFCFLVLILVLSLLVPTLKLYIITHNILILTTDCNISIFVRSISHNVIISYWSVTYQLS